MRGHTVTIEMPLKRGKVSKTIPLYQYDYGQKLLFSGVEMPEHYEVHFSNEMHGEAFTMLGNNTGVNIPDSLLATGLPVYLWVYLHETVSDGETEFQGVIPVIRRASISDTPPTPAEQGIITQAIAALNDATGKAETAQGKAEDAQDAAETAQGKAEDAQAAAETAQGKAEDAQEAAETAQGAAENAQEAAESAQSAAESAQEAAETAQAAAEEAAEEAEEAMANKADKVASATSGNFAGLDSNGNLTDSGKSPENLQEVKETNESTADLYLADPSGNVLAQFANGHIQTKNFNSSSIPAPTSIIDDTAGSGDENKVWSADKTSEEIETINGSLDGKVEEPLTEGTSGQVLTTDGNGGRSWTTVQHDMSTVSVKDTDATEGDLDLVDSSGNILLRLENGHIKTKNFDSNKNSRIKTRMGFGAHNGAEYYAPECTIPAYRIAGQQGWEWAWIAGIDFSTDGTMYVIHDDTVDRTTDGTGYLNQMTDAQINALHITQTGSGYDLSDFEQSELIIPTLEQVIQQCVRYGMKMVMRLSLFPNGKNTSENTAKWEAFEDIIHGYGIQPEDMSCYLDTGTKAITCRNLFGEDVEICTHLGINATAQDFVDWFESRELTGRRAAILSYQQTNLAAVKLLHEHGIRCYSYGTNLQANADNCASWGVDIYQNGKIHEISY